MASIFTKIIKGEIPCYKIAEDEHHFAFLDIRPLHIGHTLVIPKKEIDYIFDLEDAELQNLIVFAKKIAVALKKSIACERIGIAVIGLEVPHAHIHLSPINSIHDLDFKNAKEISKDTMLEIAEKIKANLDL
ncbi:MAG TPA: HIT family protein [Chitinophagales bacterium]|nr:HIT family protein [Chitinophagales bacterium]HMX59133.1 HIT family protein [Chitinophagales bacterium]HMY22783.1 HIT family protein [Chitinophagales bacterium]HMZ33262.1 HIT family protein [Chitinophagales bacterium]HNB50141.1 HIT family protein [Chitinophagales bacterium]